MSKIKLSNDELRWISFALGVVLKNCDGKCITNIELINESIKDKVDSFLETQVQYLESPDAPGSLVEFMYKDKDSLEFRRIMELIAEVKRGDYDE